jgi:purine-nucleoside phosphorylase
MTEQKKDAVSAAKFIKKMYPGKFNPKTALITDEDFKPGKDLKVLAGVRYSDIPRQPPCESLSNGKLLFCRAGKADVLVMNGRNHFYDGTSMRDLGHPIYVLKELGIKKIISIDETGHLHPRFDCGEIALVFDHINLMGSNPLIGENDDSIGLRFPDMSNAYDEKLFNKIKEVLLTNRIPFHESVYLGLPGPASETDAEARFYRQILADVLGYSLVPENIAAVHVGIQFAGLGLITRNLVADVMQDDMRNLEQKQKDRDKSLAKTQNLLRKALKEIIEAV